MNTIDALAGGNMLAWDEVMAQPFERVITKLMMNKVNNAFKVRYQEIMTAKAKGG